jgi:hypothetical protein
LASTVSAFAQHRLGAVHVAFLQTRAADVHPPSAYPGSISVTLRERRFGALEVALQQQADAVVVPAFADGLVEQRRRLPASCPGTTRSVASAVAITVVGMSGIFFMPPDTFDVSPVYTYFASSCPGALGRSG